MIQASLQAMGTSLMIFGSNKLVFNMLNFRIPVVYATLLLMRWLKKLIPVLGFRFDYKIYLKILFPLWLEMFSNLVF